MRRDIGDLDCSDLAAKAGVRLPDVALSPLVQPGLRAGLDWP